MPTFAELTGGWGEGVAAVDGISLLPLLQGQQQSVRRFLYREFPGYGGQLSLREGDWKLVRQNLGKGDTSVELYNIASDPGESTDLADQHPDRVRAMLQRVLEIRSPSELFPLKQYDGR